MNKAAQVVCRGLAVAVVVLVGIAAIRVGVAQGASVPEAAIKTARQMLTLQNYAGALTKLNAVLKEHPDNGEARFLKGLALAYSDQTEAALALFEALVEDYPKMTEAWNNLGVLRARSGDLVGARKALARAAQLDPEHVAARQNLGDVYVALARQAYADASALAPDSDVLKAKSRRLAGFMRSVGVAGDEPSAAAHSADSTPAPEQKPAPTPVAGGGTAEAVTPSATARADTSIGRSADTAARSAASTPAPEQKPAPTRVATVGIPEIVAPTAAARSDTGTGRSATEAVRAALQQWARAWSAQNLEAYFGAYSDHFDPLGTRSVEQWRELRRRRVSNPEWIAVELSNIEIALVDTDTAVVHFAQHYQSNSYEDHVRKTVTMTRGPQGWLITTES